MWHDLADWYLEISKTQDHTLAPQILLEAIKLLHPFTPFVTEEIFQHLPREKNQGARKKFLMVSAYPKTFTWLEQREINIASVEKLKEIVYRTKLLEKKQRQIKLNLKQ